jgi:hypothetical protein
MIKAIYITGFIVCFALILLFIEIEMEIKPNGWDRPKGKDKAVQILSEVGMAVALSSVWLLVVAGSLGAIIISMMGEE